MITILMAAKIQAVTSALSNSENFSFSPLQETKTVASRLREEGIQSAVIDTESSMIKFGLAQQISTALGATYLTLENLKSDSIVDAVRASAPFDIRLPSGDFSV